MGKYYEPKLMGLTRKKRKEFFRSVYRFLEAGETVEASDQENYGCRWRRPQQKNIGQVVPEGCRGQFRRRSAPFKKL